MPLILCGLSLKRLHTCMTMALYIVVSCDMEPFRLDCAVWYLDHELMSIPAPLFWLSPCVCSFGFFFIFRFEGKTGPIWLNVIFQLYLHLMLSVLPCLAWKSLVPHTRWRLRSAYCGFRSFTHHWYWQISRSYYHLRYTWLYGKLCGCGAGWCRVVWYGVDAIVVLRLMFIMCCVQYGGGGCSLVTPKQEPVPLIRNLTAYF